MSVEGSIHEEASAGTASIKSSLTSAESSRNRADSTGSHLSERLEGYDEEHVLQEEQEGHDIEKQEQGAHVEYILVAEFEVDQGPLMEHQYPNAISGDEQ